MAFILNDYFCESCRFIFESSSCACPECGAECAKVYRKAPSVLSGRTKGTDAALRDFSESQGMSDLSNAGGTPVKKVDASKAIWSNYSESSRSKTPISTPFGVPQSDSSVFMATRRSAGLDQKGKTLAKRTVRIPDPQRLKVK